MLQVKEKCSCWKEGYLIVHSAFVFATCIISTALQFLVYNYFTLTYYFILSYRFLVFDGPFHVHDGRSMYFSMCEYSNGH